MAKREISAMLLAAVLLPTLLLASLHRHQPVQEPDDSVCAECQSHVPHSHLSGISHTEECLVCQFLTVVWLASDSGCADTLAMEHSAMAAVSVERPVLASVLVYGLRAPPAVFC